MKDTLIRKGFLPITQDADIDFGFGEHLEESTIEQVGPSIWKQAMLSDGRYFSEDAKNPSDNVSALVLSYSAFPSNYEEWAKKDGKVIVPTVYCGKHFYDKVFPSSTVKFVKNGTLPYNTAICLSTNCSENVFLNSEGFYFIADPCKVLRVSFEKMRT